jgi:Flp pilus assembly protein TadG
MMRRLFPDRRGTATVEFALWATLVLAVLVPCLDFAAYIIAGSSMSAAIDQASVLAYNQRNSDTINTSQLSSFVTASTWAPGNSPSTTITCNGGLQSCGVTVANRQCTCVTGLTPVYTAAASCGASCPSGATSGYYLTIQTQMTYKPILVPDAWLSGGTLARAVTVRLQ